MPANHGFFYFRLSDLEAFIEAADKGLTQDVSKGDYNTLVEVMAMLGEVKERQEKTDEMFEPMKQTIELLRQYGQEMPDEVHQQLQVNPTLIVLLRYLCWIAKMFTPMINICSQVLPEKWLNTKKISILTKQVVAPLQAKEVANIRKKSADFDVRQHQLREKFRRVLAFFYDTDEPYMYLDHQNNVVKRLEDEMHAMQESARVFEVMLPEYKQIKACRKELPMLKMLWDYVFLTRTSIDDWQTTLWSDINCEHMENECKKFAKDIRNLDKEMRAWDVYAGVENLIKNMITSLKAVAELQNPAIRGRHWDQLMAATGVREL